MAWTESHKGRAVTIEAKPDGLHLCAHTAGEDPVPYMDSFITIPLELVHWFGEVVNLAVNRAPLFAAGMTAEDFDEAPPADE